MMHPRTLWKPLAVSLVLLAAIALTVLVRAPAAWFGDLLQSRGSLRLVDARGTIWDGSGMLAVSDGHRAFLLPGRVAWRLSVPALATGRIEAVLSHQGLPSPVSVSIGMHGLRVGSGSAQLPAAMLTAFGGALRTLRPGGTLDLRWTDLLIQGGMLAGEIQAEWRDAQSALSGVAPLGAYRARLDGSGGGGARLQLETLSGPLRLQGKGGWTGGKMSFRGSATADPDMRHLLDGLLGVLGPRSGDNVLLVLEG